MAERVVWLVREGRLGRETWCGGRKEEEEDDCERTSPLGGEEGADWGPVGFDEGGIQIEGDTGLSPVGEQLSHKPAIDHGGGLQRPSVKPAQEPRP